MRVLIVGCGYVGLPLGIRLVQRGHDVFGLRRTGAEELRTAGITPLTGDFTSAQAFNGFPRNFDWVVNCAASGGGSADDYRRLYLEGNRNLVAWFADSPPRKFVYTSSTSVYAQNDGSWVTEESVAEPDSPTAKVLVETEKLLLAAARDKFPSVVLRVAGIYGPGRGHAFKQFLCGEARIEGDGSRYMNMIHRDDVIGAVIAVLEGGRPGEIYNAADNEPVTQLKFFEWLAEQFQRAVPPRVAATAEIWRKRGFTNKRVSNARLRQELKYQFVFPDFRAGYGPMCVEALKR